VDPEGTISQVTSAPTWDKRVALIRLIAQRHGTAEHSRIYAAIARAAYVPHLAPDFAYIHESEFYERDTFRSAYAVASEETSDFSTVDESHLAGVLERYPKTLLVFRTMLGLAKSEFAQATVLVAGDVASGVSVSRVDSMEKHGKVVKGPIAALIAKTITQVMDGSLFGDPPGGLRSKQSKVDTENGWVSVQSFADNRVPYSDFLHQRHYGGAFRQVLDATSSQRGNIIEDAVEQLFLDSLVPYIRTGAHDQGDIAKRFEIQVQPAPDFVVYDSSGSLRAMLECKLVNDGGTARDKALRFERLRAESVRLGGIPLLAVLSGMGWTRVNDTLGPVVRDTDGRVFALSNLPEMLDVAPFPSLIGTAPNETASIENREK
jgi:hypothetical protein